MSNRDFSWNPSAMELTCLKQLDRAGSWKMLNADPPELTDMISWRHVRRIFGFNWVLFAAIFALMILLVARGSGYQPEDMREDMVPGIVAILVLSVLMALYSANIYRLAWNHRARSLRSGYDDEQIVTSIH